MKEVVWYDFSYSIAIENGKLHITQAKYDSLIDQYYPRRQISINDFLEMKDSDECSDSYNEVYSKIIELFPEELI